MPIEPLEKWDLLQPKDGLLSETPDLSAIRYSMLPYKEQGQLTNVPLYAAR